MLRRARSSSARTGRSFRFAEARSTSRTSSTIISDKGQDGVLSVFSAGRYLDRIKLGGAEPLFQERIVVFDNKRIDTLLAIPL